MGIQLKRLALGGTMGQWNNGARMIPFLLAVCLNWGLGHHHRGVNHTAQADIHKRFARPLESL